MFNFLRSLLRSILDWGRKKAILPAPKKEFTLIYGWASPTIAPLYPCPYTYVFRVSPAAYYDRGLRSGRRVRAIVFSQIIMPTSLYSLSDANQRAADIWHEITPSIARPATHRIEIGILRKGSGIPRSPFFSEYFCFESLKKPSDRVAIQIAGFLAAELEEAKVFNGAATGSDHAYWLLCIYAGWKQFGRSGD